MGQLKQACKSPRSNLTSRSKLLRCSSVRRLMTSFDLRRKTIPFVSRLHKPRSINLPLCMRLSLSLQQRIWIKRKIPPLFKVQATWKIILSIRCLITTVERRSQRLRNSLLTALILKGRYKSFSLTFLPSVTRLSRCCQPRMKSWTSYGVVGCLTHQARNKCSKMSP